MPEPDATDALRDAGRLEALRETGLLEVDSVEAFDHVARLSRELLDVPVAFVNLLRDDRQVFMSCDGLPGLGEEGRREGPLEHSYCKHVVASGEPLVVGDAREHPLLADSPAIDELGAVAYLGVPLTTRDGHVLGTHCVLDHEPRDWTEGDVAVAADLAELASAELDLRRDRARLARLRDELDRRVEERTADLLESEQRLREAQRIARLGNWEWYPDRDEVHWSEEKFRLLGYEPGQVEPSYRAFRRRVHPQDRARLNELVEEVRQGGDDFEARFRLQMPDGEVRWVHEWAHRTGDGEERRLVGVTQDVTALRRVREKLEMEERRYRELFEHNVAGVFRSTPDGEILECNLALARMLGFEEPAELEGTDAGRFYPSRADREGYIEVLDGRGALVNQELELRDREGATVWALENSVLSEDPGTGEPVIQGTLVDITARKEAERRLEEMAYEDPLTGLGNRRLLKDQAGRIFSLAERRERYVGLAYMDLDHFKRINDRWGHRAGDRVLRVLAERLRERSRRADLVARMGGDEFVVLLADLDTADQVLTATRRLTSSFDRPVAVDEGQDVPVEGSVGVSVFPVDGRDLEALLRHADRALQRAKRRGARMARYQPERDVGVGESLELDEAARAGLAAGQFRVHYQPIVTLPDRAPAAAEALVRWDHPERGFLEAKEFVPQLERSGAIRAVDRWVLEEVVASLSRWQRAGGGPRAVAVNMSALSFRDPALHRHAVSVLEEAELPDPGGLVVEVTESEAMYDPSMTLELLAALREAGVGVALDDFGTGHSSLSYLDQFPVDHLKLDRRFIAKLGEESDERLVRAMIQLGAQLGLETTAEGVEAEAHLEWLTAAGCDRAQGYLLGRPGPVGNGEDPWS